MSEKLERLTSELRQHCKENGIQFHAIFYDENTDCLAVSQLMSKEVFTSSMAEYFIREPNACLQIMVKLIDKNADINLDTE